MNAPSYLRYANQGATRNLPLDPRLVSSLGFLGDMGVTAEVFSGGQPGKGSGGRRVGSTRHDHGGAGDFRFYKDGRQLDWARAEDRPVFQEIVRRGKAAGITGFGAGDGYMGAGTMHVGFGAPGTWGAGGRGANAPDWLRDAYGDGPAPSLQETMAARSASRPVGPDAQPSPLTRTLADRRMAGGSGSSTLAGGAGGDQIASGGSGPIVNIGLPPDQSARRAGLEGMLESGTEMGSNAKSIFEVAGGLAQVWAATRGMRKLDEAEHSALTKAYAERGFTPDEMAIAQARGGREGYADVLVARQANAQRAAERDEAQAWRQDERDYDRRRDAVGDERWEQEMDLRRQAAARDGLPSGYRSTATGMEPIPGGPADPSVTARDNFRQATPEEAAGYGSAGGQFGPDGRFYPVNPPSGMTVESDGQGGVRVVQGSGVGQGGGKVPSNFEPDPANPGGVRPIAGGPGEQLPAEFAGRVGIADSFLGQAPVLREKLASGAVTGMWDRAQAGNNASSDQAGVYRQLQSGADALQRLLTGAGLTESEAATYAGRYLPTYTDDAASAVTKLDQMVREIENVRAASLRGRGGMGATVTPNGPTTPPAGGGGLVPGSDAGMSMPGAPQATGLPEGVSEEDVLHTMQVHGLTREQVLERIR